MRLGKLRSQTIEDYFRVRLSELVADTVVPFDVHLYFTQNNHIMIFRAAGTELTAEFFLSYHRKGIRELWVYEGDRGLFDQYLSEKMTDSERAELLADSIREAHQDGIRAKELGQIGKFGLPANNSAEPEIIFKAGSFPDPLVLEPNFGMIETRFGVQSGTQTAFKPDPELIGLEPLPSEPKDFLDSHSIEQEIPKGIPKDIPNNLLEEKVLTLVLQQVEHSVALTGLIQSDSTDAKRRMALTAKTARTILKQSMEAGDFENQTKANEATKRIVKDVLSLLTSQSSPQSSAMIVELWDATSSDPHLAHATNVAAYSVLLALAFGKVEPDLLTDLALAGLLHDIGITQLPTQITHQPWKNLKSDEFSTYTRHVKEGIEIIKAFGPDIPDRVKFLISQHHEKFDGTGYPDKVQGFSLDGSSQILAISEHLDSIATGQWDGQKRSYKESLQILNGIEKTRAFPEYFNPEVLSAVMRWAADDSNKELNQKALEFAEQQRTQLLNSNKAA